MSTTYDKNKAIAEYMTWVKGYVPNLTLVQSGHLLRFSSHLKLMVEDEYMRIISYSGYQDSLNIKLKHGGKDTEEYQEVEFIVKGDTLTVKRTKKHICTVPMLTNQLLSIS